MTASGSRIEAALAVLQADAIDSKRQAMWRYGVRHAIAVIENHLAAKPEKIVETPRPEPLDWDY